MPLRRRRLKKRQPTPTISGVSIHDISETSVGIRWDTDVLTKARIDYGTTTSYGSSVTSDVWDTTQDITITGLTDATLYHYRITAVGRDSTKVDSDRTFTTQASGVTPVISNINIHSVTETGAQVEWNVVPNATGLVRYGTSSTNLNLTAQQFEPNFLGYHNQRMGTAASPSQTPLVAGTTYYLQIEGTDSSGRTGTSGIESFTTQSSGVTATGMYAGIGTRTLANTQTRYLSACSFRAARSLAVSTARAYFQGGSTYAAGNGGTYRFRILADNGSGRPNLTGPVYGTTANLTGFPTSSGGNSPGRLLTFSSTVALVAGNRYWFVMENVDASPSSNNTSINTILQGTSPYHWRFQTALDWLHIYWGLGESGWTVRTGYAVVLQLNYSDGYAQGQPYMEISYSSVPSQVADVNDATSRMVRQPFTTTSAVSATGAAITMRKLAGSTGALTVAIRSTGAGRGTSLGSLTIPASSFMDGAMSGSDSPKTTTWAGNTFSSPIALSASTSYRLEFSTTGNSEFMTWPIRHGGLAGYGYSTANDGGWPGGSPWQYSTDNGSNWTNGSGNDDQLPAALEWAA